MNPEFRYDVFLLVMGGWIFSVCLHEFAHALVAYIGGDTTVRDKGYLTFNPFRYTHPVLSIILPLVFLMLGGIGLPGGAVYIDRSRLRSRHWACAVSLAGPLSNALLLALLSLPFHFGLADPTNRFWQGYAFLCTLEVMGVLFNLLPVPPLDGFGAISSYLNPSIRQWLYSQGHLFFLLLFVIFWRVDSVNRVFWKAVFWANDLAGIPGGMVFDGLQQVRILG